jgi:hypothetical protein
MRLAYPLARLRNLNNQPVVTVSLLYAESTVTEANSARVARKCFVPGRT